MSWEVKARESQKAQVPRSLVYMVAKKRPCLKQGKARDDIGHACICARACTHTHYKTRCLGGWVIDEWVGVVSFQDTLGANLNLLTLVCPHQLPVNAHHGHYPHCLTGPGTGTGLVVDATLKLVLYLLSIM